MSNISLAGYGCDDGPWNLNTVSGVSAIHRITAPPLRGRLWAACQVGANIRALRAALPSYLAPFSEGERCMYSHSNNQRSIDDLES
jgi:hypothetical protein